MGACVAKEAAQRRDQYTFVVRPQPARRSICLDKHRLKPPSIGLKSLWPAAQRPRKRAFQPRRAQTLDHLAPIALIGPFDNHFRALPMAADGGGQAVGLADRQIS